MEDFERRFIPDRERTLPCSWTSELGLCECFPDGFWADPTAQAPATGAESRISTEYTEDEASTEARPCSGTNSEDLLKKKEPSLLPPSTYSRQPNVLDWCMRNCMIDEMQHILSKLPIDNQEMEQLLSAAKNTITDEMDHGHMFLENLVKNSEKDMDAPGASTASFLDKEVLNGDSMKSCCKKLLSLAFKNVGVSRVDVGEFPRPNAPRPQWPSILRGVIKSSLRDGNDIILCLEGSRQIRLLLAARSDATQAELDDLYPKGATLTVMGDFYRDGTLPWQFIAVNQGKLKVEPRVASSNPLASHRPGPGLNRGSERIAKYLSGGCRASDVPRLQDHIGPVVIGARAAGGIGLFAEGDIPEGYTVIVSNAVGYARDTGDSKQIFKDVYAEVVRAALSSPRTRQQVSLLWDKLFAKPEAHQIPDISLFKANTVDVSGEEELPLDVDKIWQLLRHNVRIGLAGGLWLLPGLLSHCCNANLVIVNIGQARILNSTRRIRKGEELTCCYGPTQILPVEWRTTFFRCHCARCITETAMKLMYAPYTDLAARYREQLQKMSGNIWLRSSAAVQGSMVQLAIDLEELLAGTSLEPTYKMVLRLGFLVPYVLLLLYKRHGGRVDDSAPAATRDALENVSDDLVVGGLAVLDRADMEVMELLTGFFPMEPTGIAPLWLDKCIKKRYGKKPLDKASFYAWLRSDEPNKARLA